MRTTRMHVIVVYGHIDNFRQYIKQTVKPNLAYCFLKDLKIYLIYFHDKICNIEVFLSIYKTN